MRSLHTSGSVVSFRFVSFQSRVSASAGGSHVVVIDDGRRDDDDDDDDDVRTDVR